MTKIIVTILATVPMLASVAQAAAISDRPEIEIQRNICETDNICPSSDDDLLKEWEPVYQDIISNKLSAASASESAPQEAYIQSTPEDFKAEGYLYEPFNTNFRISFDNFLQRIEQRANECTGDSNKYQVVPVARLSPKVQNKMEKIDNANTNATANFLTPDGLDYVFRTSVWRRAIKVKHAESEHFDLLGFYKDTGIDKMFHQFDVETNLKFQDDFNPYFPNLYDSYRYPNSSVFLVKPTETVSRFLWGWIPPLDYTFQIERGCHYAQMMKYNTVMNYIPVGNSEGYIYLSMTIFYDTWFPCLINCAPAPKNEEPASDENVTKN
ncbi:hypothetical protein WICPIJ_003439 [Wickerhamomyces pijperi]|uniref:Secreted protein n=1 Tax=Wickerhamomyces pijperi TaxID=599730 RepID=A0A9P8Q740_WICPI|nr:hypothetical protein WICPIJ_003439 [Wickerhamomyces pijperi]